MHFSCICYIGPHIFSLTDMALGQSVDGGGVRATFEIKVQPFHLYNYNYGVV